MTAQDKGNEEDNKPGFFSWVGSMFRGTAATEETKAKDNVGTASPTKTQQIQKKKKKDGTVKKNKLDISDFVDKGIRDGQLREVQHRQHKEMFNQNNLQHDHKASKQQFSPKEMLKAPRGEHRQ